MRREILEFKNRSNSVSHLWCQSACHHRLIRLHQFDFRQSRSQGQWSLLSWRAAVTTVAICHTSGLAFLISEFLIVQQDSASAQRARETFNFLQRETPAFISPDLWSPNNPDHSPVDYQIWGISESRQKCTGCGRFEAASDWCLDWYSTKRYLQCHWVAQASPYRHSGHRRTFWILTVTQ